MEAVASRPSRDAWVIGLIGSGHFFSHFYQLALPPLLPLMKDHYGISWQALGLIGACYNLSGGVLQVPIGFLVDRFGPRHILIAGLAPIAIGAMAFVPDFWMIVALALLAGIGNSVFHPADYSIMSGSISKARIGRAYALHTFSGFFGGALAPPIMVLLLATVGWQNSLIVAALAGLAVALALWLRGDLLVGEAQAARGRSEGPAAAGGASVLLSPAILMLFFFFIAYGAANGGLTQFMIPALMSLHALSLEAATQAFTGNQLAIAAGVLVGGLVADRIRAHALLASAALGACALFLFLPGAMPVLGAWTALVLFVAAGLAMGIVLPPRDVIVRGSTPPGQIGKVFGFVSVGLSIGQGVSPLVFGAVLDRNMPAALFLGAAALMLVAMSFILVGDRKRRHVAAA